MQLQNLDDTRRGSRITAVLAGIWRAAPPPLSLNVEQFAAVAPCLLETGAGAAAWWRVRQAGWTIIPPVIEELQDACRLHTLQNAYHLKQLKEVLALFGAAGIEPLLVKGWSSARLYSEPELRPCGDIDLCVPPEQLSAAVEILTRGAGRYHLVDLHQGVADLDGRSWQQILQRSRTVSFPGGSVRVMGAEDQLRHLCLHLLRHGAYRPMWLCDVGAALERAGADFDWSYCLSGNSRLTDWVVYALGLANRLLGARIGSPEIAERAAFVPKWLITSVLHQWGLGGRSRDFVSVAEHLRRRGGVCAAVRDRWRNLNLVEVLFHWRSRPYRRVPAWFLRSAAMLARLEQYLVRRWRKTRQRPDAITQPFEVHPQQACRWPWLTG